MRKYDFFTDPGHGWLKVKRQELIDLGIENQITGYSYQRGDYVYLEEDADASLFADTWEAKHGTKFVFDTNTKRHYADRESRIRRYEPFKSDLDHQHERDEKIDDMIDQVRANMASYHDFVLDCVKEIFSKWNDEQLDDFLGKE